MGNVKKSSGNRISQRRGRTIASRASLSIFYLLRLFIVAFLLGSHDLLAQSGGPGVQLSGPESSHGGAPLCDGMPVGYQTNPLPAAGVCLDSIKECVLKGGQASWQTKTFFTGFSRSCVPSAQVDACQPYECVAGAGSCSPSGTPVKCDPSADGCTIYACDPEKPGTCIITEKKDSNQCVVTWQDQETPCGGATIYHKVVDISDPCCKYKVGYTEPTSRVSPACPDSKAPTCSLTVNRIANTDQCTVTVQSNNGPVDGLRLFRQATNDETAPSVVLSLTAPPRSMTSIIVQNMTENSSVTAGLTINAIGGDTISNKSEHRTYGVCNWNGERCYSWEFPHGGAIACQEHSTCSGDLRVMGGETKQADYGSVLDMKKSSFGVQARNQNTAGAGARVIVKLTSTSPFPAKVAITVDSFDDFTDKKTKALKETIIVAGDTDTLVDSARNWGGPTSETFRETCRISDVTRFEAQVRYNGMSSRCSQSVPPPPPDTCGRNARTESLSPEPDYMNGDCCAGVVPPKKFRAYDNLQFDVQEEFGSLAYKDGSVQWMCQRNSSAVTVVHPNAMFNLAFLGYSNNARVVLDRHIKAAYEGKAANSCFVCGQTRTEGGCFPPGVIITTGDGSTFKRVEDVRAGDVLWNPVLKRGFKVVTISEGRERKDIVVVRAGGQTLRMTTEHPVLTKEGMKQAIDLARGDTVVDSNGRDVLIDAITKDPATPGLSVLNFILERSGGEHDGLLLADGLVVGDLTIQRRLAADAKK